MTTLGEFQEGFKNERKDSQRWGWTEKQRYCVLWASQVVLVVKNPGADARDIRDTGLSLGWEDPLEKGTATHSRILAWRVPCREEPGRLQSIRSQRVGRNLAHTHTHTPSTEQENFMGGGIYGSCGYEQSK